MIAEGSIKPFIIVRTYGMTNEVKMGRMKNFKNDSFQTALVDELIPYRAMAGLSVGSNLASLLFNN